MLYSIVVKSTGGYKAGEYTCGSIVVNYLGACNSMIFNQCSRDGFNVSMPILWPILHLWNAKLGIMQE